MGGRALARRERIRERGEGEPARPWGTESGTAPRSVRRWAGRCLVRLSVRAGSGAQQPSVSRGWGWRRGRRGGAISAPRNNPARGQPASPPGACQPRHRGLGLGGPSIVLTKPVLAHHRESGGDTRPSAGQSGHSSVLRRRKSPAASRMWLNSMQKACTSINRSCTLMILLRMRLWRKTQTRRTRRFCMYLSLMFSHEEMQFEM
mmetsp:Transcript_8681/g.25242  ORF Transcript_8681/g.25242 Transcript_8681/m.25242 type:complete len:204 (+) Transcript_8681:361-972(+)